MQQQTRFLLFLGLMILVGGAWFAGKAYFYPEPPAAPQEKPADFGVWDVTKLDKWAFGGPITFGVWDVHKLPFWAFAQEKRKESTRLTLGSDDPKSDYQLRVTLDSRGAGVLSVLLNRFQATDDK